MHSLSNLRKNVRKGQFFILTTVAVVTILFFISRWTGPLTQVDTSDIVASGELFTFDNIKEKTFTLVKNSESCEELNYNLQEYKNFIDDYAREENYKIIFTYNILPGCEQFRATIVAFSLQLISDKIDARGSFDVTWP